MAYMDLGNQGAKKCGVNDTKVDRCSIYLMSTWCVYRIHE